MIIFVRGNHGSGKSTVVRNVWNRMVVAEPIYGILGAKKPEAYRCRLNVKPTTKHAFVLGPYDSPTTAGLDYITKKGVAALVHFLEYYRSRGHILAESTMLSARFMAPTVGTWLQKHKSEFIGVTLDTTLEQCVAAIKTRQQTSIHQAYDNKHIEAQQRMLENVTKQLTEKGFRLEYASREMAPDLIMRLLREH